MQIVLRIVMSAVLLLGFALPVRAGHAPTIRMGRTADQSQLLATFDGLTVTKIGTNHRVAIELRFGGDVVTIEVRADHPVSVTRRGVTLQASSADHFARIQGLLGDSTALAAARQLLSERLDVTAFDAPELSLLTAVSYAISLTGDVDAPLRLSDKFMAKVHGVFRVAKAGFQPGRTCSSIYSTEVSASWDDLQACMSEANQDDSLLNRAYRRVACNGVWLGRSESAWFEYLDCIAIGKAVGEIGK